MLISYLLKMNKQQGLRSVLAQNIRKARASLRISQAKLAEFANISTSHMIDIEYCKTWVSDKTLQNIAKALNMQSYELLIPEISSKINKTKVKSTISNQTAVIISGKKRVIKQKVGEIMDDLIIELNKIDSDKN